MQSRIDLNDVRLLMQVVESGSYTAASRATGIPKSTISQRIAALERAVGTGLLRRTSRSFSLTETGSLILPHAHAIDDLSRKIEQQLAERGPELAGTLRVSSSVVLAQFVLAPLVPRFLEQHPRVSIDMQASNRLVDLVGEGFDMAVRGHLGPLKDSILLQRVVARTPWIVATSPAWIDAHGVPSVPEDIPPDQTLCFSGVRPDYSPWRLRWGESEVAVQMRPRLVSDDMITLRDAAAAGSGIVCLPAYVLVPLVRTGQLVPILPDWDPAPSSVSVLTPPKLQSSRLAQAFSDFLAKEMPRVVRI